MAFDAAREQTFAAALAAPSERGAAAFGFHTGAETVLAFARAFGRLIGAFHKAGRFARRDFGAVTVEMRIALSIARKLTVDLAFAHCQRTALFT
jgi:hypothetical protein